MKMSLEPGRVVLSIAGRDADRLFVVLEQVNEQYYLIADGELRKTSRPKKKKVKHLKAKPHVLDIITSGTVMGADLDAKLRKCLLALKNEKTSKEE